MCQIVIVIVLGVDFYMLDVTKLQLFVRTGTISVRQKCLYVNLGKQIIALDVNQTFKVHVKAKKFWHAWNYCDIIINQSFLCKIFYYFHLCQDQVKL